MQEVKILKHRELSVREMAYCGLFTALIATGAFIKINIPVQPFPMHFTLQFFFVLLSGFLMGAKRGALSVGVYLAVGLIGVPVFAAGGGPAYLVRPTFGFLLGFVFAAFTAGYLVRLREKTSLRWNLFSAFWGMMAMYLSGMVYFYFISNFVIHMPVTWKIVFINCFLLTVGGDFVLCIMAAVLAKRLKPVIGLED
ncbi:MAG: biotin transporter BioY [Clostridium sp.]|nr:biotin transporter BioY [Clostridium sp.]